MTHDQNQTHRPVLATCSPRRGLVGLLRSVAGAPAGWRPSRRGSFLVIVVGTLALLAVMAVVYTTIGNHDARMYHASDKREKLDDVPQQVADYIARLIGEDTISVQYSTRNHTDSNGFIVLERKTSDYPSTSWGARSDLFSPPGGNSLAVPFSPTGSVSGFLTSPDLTIDVAPSASTARPGSMPRLWEPTSPWLAATEPTFLAYPNGGNPRTPTDPGRPYLDNHDWPHISNIAPDGTFVNLFNLWNNWDNSRGVVGNTPFMSQNLSLYDNTGRPGANVTDFGLAVDPRFPAHYDSRQQWLFRPARPTTGILPSDPRFDPYQFADADGDGMYDSRWQALEDFRSLLTVATGNTGALTSVLHTDGKIRYFVAARIIDASSMANVNKAGDMHVAPVAHMPAGATPSEIDLQRILRMRDAYDNNDRLAASIPAGYDGLFQPGWPSPAQPVAANYLALNGDNGYDRGRAQIVGDLAYTSLRLAQAGGSIPSIDFRGFGNGSPPYLTLATDFAASFAVPVEAWDNYSPTDFTSAPYLGFGHPVLRAKFFADHAAAYDDTIYQGAVPAASPPTFGAWTFAGSYGLDDMLELVGRRTVNNPLYTSPLEATLDGRDDSITNTFPNTLRFGVLRSNRPLDVEHDLRYNPPAQINAAFITGNAAYGATMLHFASDVRQRLTTISRGRDFRLSAGVTGPTGAFFPGVGSDSLDETELRADPRLAMSDIEAANSSTLNPPPAQLLEKRSEGINSIFQAYANALLPTSGIRVTGGGSPWNTGAPDFDRRRTEFYGHQGPELALHAAAHMTVNFMDMFDAGSVPTVHTLLLSSGAPTLSFLNNPANLPLYPAWDQQYNPPGDKHGLRPLQLSASTPQNPGRLADPADTFTAPAINVYGVEPQPFLTQVAAFTVYGDTSVNGGGDDEGAGKITIKGDIDYTTNHDLMYRVVAFQLTNPFGVSLTLGGAPTVGGVDTSYFDVTDPQYPRPDRESNFYYIRFGDKVFKIASLNEAIYVDAQTANNSHAQHAPDIAAPDPNYLLNNVYIQPGDGGDAGRMIHLRNITIPAGKSVVCYVLSDIPRRIMSDRLAKLEPTDTTAEGYYFNKTDTVTMVAIKEIRSVIKSVIEHQLNGDTGADVSGVFWIPQIDVDVNNPTVGTGQVILPESTNLFPGARTEVVELWRSARYEQAMETIPQSIRLPSIDWDAQTAPPPTTGTLTLTPPNDFRNDQLLDRMRVPTGLDLNQDSRLPNGDHEVENSEGENDAQHLYMIETHASVRRKGDPRPNNAKPPLGAIPGYCLEPKYQTDWNLNDASRDLAAGLDRQDFTASGAAFKGGGLTPKEWVRKMRAGHLDRYAADADHPYGMWQAPCNFDDGTSTTRIVPAVDPDATGTTVSYDNFYPQISIQNHDFEPYTIPTPTPPATRISTLRPADMLLPLGIGPEETPFLNVNGTPTAVVDNEVRWTTLGEALALLYGYQANTAPGGAVESISVYNLPAGTKAPLDRGNLRLDDYAPYYGNGSGTFNPSNCERLGNQLPLALNVMDVFTVSPSRSVTTTDNKQALEINPQTLTRGARGKININTVPLNTLRPGFDMLSPPPAQDANNQPWWWWTRDAVTNNMPPLDEHVDIAPTVIAYRDKGTSFMRPGSFFGTSNTLDSVYFFDTAANPAQPNGLDGRTATTQIGQLVPGTINLAPLHEQPGFRSVGELMAVRYRDGDPASPSYRCNMDWLGHDNLPPAPGVPAGGGPGSQTLYRAGASGHVGVDSVLFATSGNPDHPSAVPNNYTEQLAIINSVLNNVSTRSDVFVAWFQIQGYQKSDVENLGDDDPMTPSVNRRFVMVIDRSKVTKRGQKADILLFKEVPVDAEPR